MPNDGARPASFPGATPNAKGRAEEIFIGRLRQALDDSARALPQATLARLALARKSALRAQRLPQAKLARAVEWAPAGGGTMAPRFGFGRASLVGSAILLVGVCLAGLYQFEQDRRIEELADVDSAVLNDDLPISAYADHGFNAFIKQNP